MPIGLSHTGALLLGLIHLIHGECDAPHALWLLVSGIIGPVFIALLMRFSNSKWSFVIGVIYSAIELIWSTFGMVNIALEGTCVSDFMFSQAAVVRAVFCPLILVVLLSKLHRTTRLQVHSSCMHSLLCTSSWDTSLCYCT